jgi:hypothetical protein
MIIQLKKFGTTLTSRQLGKEALAAFSSSLPAVGETGDIEIDFDGVNTFSPSWGDEFLTPLAKKYGAKLILRHSDNSSVAATLKLLEEVNGYTFTVK